MNHIKCRILIASDNLFDQRLRFNLHITISTNKAGSIPRFITCLSMELDDTLQEDSKLFWLDKHQNMIRLLFLSLLKLCKNKSGSSLQKQNIVIYSCTSTRNRSRHRPIS